MRAYIFTPGDMICRKGTKKYLNPSSSKNLIFSIILGEIAREMFIIADGVLEVIGYN